MSTFTRARSLIPRLSNQATRHINNTYYRAAQQAGAPFAWRQGSSAPVPLLTLTKAVQSSFFSTSARRMDPSLTTPVPNPVAPEESNRNDTQPEEETKHAVVSTFDLFSIGIGPSSRYELEMLFTQTASRERRSGQPLPLSFLVTIPASLRMGEQEANCVN